MSDKTTVRQHGREKIVDLLCDTFGNRWSWTWETNRHLGDGELINLYGVLCPAGIVIFEDYGRDGFEMYMPGLGNSIDGCQLALQERAERLTGD